MANVRWKDKTDIATLAGEDRIPVTDDPGSTAVDKYFTATEMAAFVSTDITISDESSDTTCFPLFATAATGAVDLKTGTNFTFNSNTGVMGCTDLSVTNDILVASGGILNFASGDILFTHAAGTLTLSGDGSVETDWGDKTLSKPILKDYGEEAVVVGNTGATPAFDLSAGNVQTATVDEAVTSSTFTNPTATGDACSLTILLTNGGAFSVAWPTSVDWPNATAPTLTASGLDILVFTTIDAGTIWHGMLASTNSS